MKKAARGAAFSCAELSDQLLAAEAGIAAEAAASGAEAGAGAGSGAGAGAATGAGAGAGASSFLPQAASATAATMEANRSDLFICVLSESVDQLPVMDLTACPLDDQWPRGLCSEPGLRKLEPL
jgi:hypothetical protein